MSLFTHKYYIDVLRLICIFCVIFNHTTPVGYMGFLSEKSAILYFVGMLLCALCKIAVPVFFMISGALLLGKDEEISIIFKKRIFRIAVVLIVCSAPYYIWLSNDAPLSVIGLFRTLYSNSATTAFWYLYSYLGYLLLLPLLRKLVKKMDPKDYCYLFIIRLIYSVVTVLLEAFCGLSLNESFTISLILDVNIFFPIMGYYFEKVLDTKYYSKKWSKYAWIVLLLCEIITCILTHLLIVVCGKTMENAQYEVFFNSTVAVSACSIFYLAKANINIIKESFINKVLKEAGTAVFGVFLIEKIMRAITGKVVDVLIPIFGNLFSALIWTAVSLLLGLIIIIGIRNIPYLDKFIKKFI